MSQEDIDFRDLLLTSEIDENNRGSQEERKDLLKALRHVSRQMFGGRSEANSVLLSMAKIPGGPTVFRAMMNNRFYRATTFNQLMGNIHS